MSKPLPLLAVALAAAAACAPAAAQNLLVNGGFEASSSTTLVPPGWFNFGAANGVLSYSAITTQPVYEGLRFYDLGAHGNGVAALGEGVGQTFASIVGATYRLTFGLSGENLGSSIETLRVSAGSGSADYALTPTASGIFSRAFTTEGFTFSALSSTTTLAFVLQSITGAPGNNDPMIDGVSVELVAMPTAPVPEPETWALMAAGLAGLGYMRRRHAR